MHICVNRPEWVNGWAMERRMMTSSNGNIFRVTGHLCVKFTGPRWIPHTKASDAEFEFSLICVWINGWANREAGDLRHYRAHYDVTVMDFEYFKEICTIISINHCICPVQTLNTLTVLVNLISYLLTVTGISVCLCFIINAFVVLFLL